MILVGRVFYVSVLLQVSFCQEFDISTPQSVEGLSGSCVAIPCNFSVPSIWNKNLDESCRAIWRRGWRRTQVFDSGLIGENVKQNIIQGQLMGNLREGDCTVIFLNLPSNSYDDYYFRLQCDNPLKYNFPAWVRVTTQVSLPRPTITPSTLQVEEGTPVTLSCSAVSPCPILPPVLTWTPGLGDSENTPTAKHVISVMNFNASYLHNGQKVSCTALYSRQAGYNNIFFEKSLTVHVFYSPQNTSVGNPGPVIEGSSVTLTCSTNANPAVDDYTWYRVDGEEAAEVGSEKTLSVKVTEADNQFFCRVSNKYGSQNSSIAQIDILFFPKETAVVFELSGPILEGSSVSLLCRTRSNPPVTNYTWYKDDYVVQEAGPVLSIDRIDPSYSGSYQCMARNDLGEETSAKIQLNVQYSPKNTSFSADPPGPVLDGSSVTLTCTTAANPAANFTWYRASGGEKEVVGSEQDFTFNVTKLSEDQYYCEALNIHGADYSEAASIDVIFPPEILPSSGCLKILSWFRCYCKSQGNPLPSLVWELAGEPVNHSAEIPIREVTMGQGTIRSLISLYHLNEDMPTLVCLSSNSLGSDSLAFNVSSSDTLGLHFVSLLIGSGAGALGMMVVCIPLVYLGRKRKGIPLFNKKLTGTAECVVTKVANSAPVDVKNGNKVTVEEEEFQDKDVLVYVNVDFDKLRSASEGEVREREIRGLASKTAEYAEICLCSRGGNHKEAKEELADTHLEQEHSIDDPTE
nr:sialic acid-binding Ig-like lectin 10 isoform X1 [Nothobranchius furzeri]